MIVLLPLEKQNAEDDCQTFENTSNVWDKVQDCIEPSLWLRDVLIQNDIDACENEIFARHPVLWIFNTKVFLSNEAWRHWEPDIIRVIELVYVDFVKLSIVIMLV